MKAKATILYALLFGLSFLLFIYVSFPYTILKEAAITEITKVSQLDIRVRTLSPNLPLGFDMEGVEVDLESGEKGFELKSVYLGISVLPLFIGNLNGTLEIENQNKERLEATVSFGLFDLIKGEFIPKVVGLESKGFAIDQFARFGLANAKVALRNQALVGDLIDKLSLKGKLAGTLDLDINPDNLAASDGNIDLKILSGALVIDKALGIADQNFEKAGIKGSLKQGSIEWDPNSGIHTQGMKIDLKGKIAMKAPIDKSVLDLELNLRLDQGFKEQFGFFIDSALGGADGALKYQVKGTFGAPNFATF